MKLLTALCVFFTAWTPLYAAAPPDISPDTALYRKYLALDEEKTQKIDFAQAVPHLKKAATAGDADALYYLGMCYASGKGVSRNENTAFRLLEAAEKKEKGRAATALACAYAAGIGTLRDVEKALKILKDEYREYGDEEDEIYRIAKAWAHVGGRPEEVFRWCQCAAVMGHEAAKIDVAYAHLTGYGAERDDAEAVKVLHRSPEYGKTLLAVCYLAGWGVTPNEPLAEFLLMDTSPLGFWGSQSGSRSEPRVKLLLMESPWDDMFYRLDDDFGNFGLAFDETEDDSDEEIPDENAVEYVRKERLTRNENNVLAAMRLIIRLSVERSDYETAEKWCRKLEERSAGRTREMDRARIMDMVEDGEGMLILCHALGRGVPRDEEKALRLAEERYNDENMEESEYSFILWKLESLEEHRHAAEQTETKYWLRKAVAAGHKRFAKELAELEKEERMAPKNPLEAMLLSELGMTYVRAREF